MVKVEAKNINMQKNADSGQIFRFNRINEEEYELIAGNKLLYIKEVKSEDGKVLDYELNCTEDEYLTVWKHFFDLDTDYNNFIKNIPPEDIFLNEAVKYSEGIHILHQDKWEMLISFIISQRKSIPAIKTSVEKLCRAFGKEIAYEKYAFPTPKQLAGAQLSELESCSLGYRAAYIYESARLVASGKFDLDKLDKLKDDELLKELMKLKGVGVKVANCVALFAYHRIGAFPIDVWIGRIIQAYYKGKFPLERYRGYAGVIQQYMFFYGRDKSRRLFD